MQVTTVGLDLAKNIFQVQGIIEDGTVAFNKSLRCAQLLQFFENLEPCLIGMEACGSGHYWARQFQKLGHEVRLMPAMYVKAYVKRGKSAAIEREGFFVLVPIGIFAWILRHYFTISLARFCRSANFSMRPSKPIASGRRRPASVVF